MSTEKPKAAFLEKRAVGYPATVFGLSALASLSLGWLFVGFLLLLPWARRSTPWVPTTHTLLIILALLVLLRVGGVLALMAEVHAVPFKMTSQQAFFWSYFPVSLLVWRETHHLEEEARSRAHAAMIGTGHVQLPRSTLFFLTPYPTRVINIDTTDPFTGRPYLSRDSILYSLGPDGVDHQGEVPYDPTNGTFSSGDALRLWSLP